MPMSSTQSPVSVPPLSSVPDALGRFGCYGGRYVPETLSSALDQLERAYGEAIADPAFSQELDGLLSAFVGRPTPLLFAQRLTEYAGGARIYFKREDLSHTGAHKINNTLGQGLLALRMGKRRVIAETGAGQHGVATAASLSANRPRFSVGNRPGDACPVSPAIWPAPRHRGGVRGWRQ